VYLFNQSHVIFVLLFRMVTCTRIPWQHFAALFVIIGGLYLSLSDDAQLTGIAVASGGALFAVPYIANATSVKASIGFIPMVIASQLSGLFVCIALDFLGVVWGADARISWAHPFDSSSGILGWAFASPNHLLLWGYLVVVGGLTGMVAYTYAAAKLPSIIVHAVMLLEPGMASLESTFMRAGLEPSERTWVGMGVITLGCMVVVCVGEKTSHGDGDHGDIRHGGRQSSSAPTESDELLRNGTQQAYDAC